MSDFQNLNGFRRREAKLFPSRGVKLPCLSARSQLFVDMVFGSIKALRECPRLVVSGHPKIIEKLSHNLAATLDFLLVGRSFGCNAYLVALGADCDAIGDRLFLCHGIHSFTGCVRIRTALPLTGQFLDELDYDLDPTRHRHTAPPPETRSFRMRRPVRPQYSWSGRCCSVAFAREAFARAL
jgi:hypothetical protein